MEKNLEKQPPSVINWLLALEIFGFFKFSAMLEWVSSRLLEGDLVVVLAIVLLTLLLSSPKIIATFFQSQARHETEETVLFVCTECKNSRRDNIKDIEDIVSSDGVRLWNQVLSNLNSDKENFSKISEGNDQCMFQETDKRIDAGQVDPQRHVSCYRHIDSGETLKVVPFRCLSLCKEACSIALSSSANRFSYQFAGLDPDAQTAQDIVDFVCSNYIPGDIGYSMTKNRPTRLRKTVRARIPPIRPVPTTAPALVKKDPLRVKDS